MNTKPWMMIRFAVVAACAVSALACSGQVGAHGTGAAGSGSGGDTGAGLGGDTGSGTAGDTGSGTAGSTGSGTAGNTGRGGTGNTGSGVGGSISTGGVPGTGGGFSGPGATVMGILIPSGHPRLFWTEAKLALAKNWWKTHSFTPRSDEYSVNDQLFAAVMTGNATYCQQAIGHMMSVNLSSCTSDKAGCDEARWSGETAILAYDWCYNVMTEAQRTTFVTNWNTWLNAIRRQMWGGVPQSQSNYYFGTLRNDIEWGIASYHENMGPATDFLTDGLVTRYTNDFIKAASTPGKAQGGLGLEGGQYGPYQSYYIGAIVFPSVMSAGRDIFNETPYWKGTVLNRIYMTPPQATMSSTKLRDGWDVFPFGDDEQWEGGEPAKSTEKGTFMTAAATQWNGTNIGMWARNWLAMVKPDVDPAAASTDPGGPSQDFSALPLDYYNGGPKYLVGRSDWTTNATAYLFQMGDHYSDGHNHDDWGAFQIHRKGRWLTRETVGYSVNVPGYGGTGTHPVYGGLAHNVPLVNGAPGNIVQGFPPGNGSEGNWTASPTVRRMESQAGYVYADVDLTGVYTCCGSSPTKGNRAAVRVEREYWFLRGIETFVILDRLQADTAARTKTFIFHCETNPTLVNATHVNCVNGTQQLSVTTLLPAAPSSRTVVNAASVTSPVPAANSQYRVEINDAPNATASYTLHVMQAMDASGTALAPTVTDSNPGDPATGTLTVTLDGQNKLTINKGMTSSGGSIVVAGQSHNLRADVQGFALDASDMPVWAP